MEILYNLLDFLYALIFRPLVVLVTELLTLFISLTENHGIAILLMSLSLYFIQKFIVTIVNNSLSEDNSNRSYALQKAESIKKTFAGYQKYLLLKELYKQQKYGLFNRIKSEIPTFIQIPVFLSVYTAFLEYQNFTGVDILFISDLSKPDGVGPYNINILPFLMLFFGLASTFLHHKKNLKKGLNSFILIIIFFVLLYASTSALLLYWTINNLLYLLFEIRQTKSTLANPEKPNMFQKEQGVYKKSYIPYSFLFISILIFVILPLSLIGQEDNIITIAHQIDDIYTVIGFLLYISIITFIILTKVLKNRKVAFVEQLLLTLLILIVLYMLLGQPDKVIFDNFIINNPILLDVSYQKIVFDIAMVAIAFLSAYFILFNRLKYQARLNKIRLISIVLLFINIGYLGSIIQAKADVAGNLSQQSTFNFSKDKANIVFLFLDGAIGGFIPDFIKDGLIDADELSGFTWYRNSVSIADRTIAGLPAMFGGWNYAPNTINKIPGRLHDKINAAYHVYAENFKKNGFDVIYTDPFWYGYKWYGDCDKLEQSKLFRCINLLSKLGNNHKHQSKSSFFDNHILKVYGQYFALAVYLASPSFGKKYIYDNSEWHGLSYSFLRKKIRYINNYNLISKIGNYSIVENKNPTFTFIGNELPRVDLLSQKNCNPVKKAKYSSNIWQRYKTIETISLFRTNYCALNAVREMLHWFKENGIYDNTMFIISSDHGWTSHNPLLIDNPNVLDYSKFQNLTLIKKINAKGPLAYTDKPIVNTEIPGIICSTINGCYDSFTKQYIQEKDTNYPVKLFQIPWRPNDQKENEYVIEKIILFNGDVSNNTHWRIK